VQLHRKRYRRGDGGRCDHGHHHHGRRTIGQAERVPAKGVSCRSSHRYRAKVSRARPPEYDIIGM
jgi:hypothetical protein